MSQRPEVHPFDVHSLSKGDWITPDRCEAVVGVNRSDRRYSLRLMDVGQDIARQWHEQRDEVVTVVCERDGLRICTDDEAVVVNRDRRLSHVRGLERAQVRQMGVDVSRLSSSDLVAKHERECIVGAAFLSGGRKDQRAALKAHKRQTPKMLPDK